MRQGGEWDVFQRPSRSDDGQSLAFPLLPQFGSDGREQGPAHPGGHASKFDVGFGDQSLMLRRGKAFLRLARGQQLMDSARSGVDSGREREVISDERVPRYSPQPALRSGKRI